MSDEAWLSEAAALRVLRQIGDYSDGQARIILGHSRKMAFGSATYYPSRYVYKRAEQNAARGENDANAVRNSD